MTGDKTIDESWSWVARDTREALRLLGHPIGVQCLPDEPEPCGGSFSEHACAHLATIKAVVDHHLDHLKPPPEILSEIYEHKLAELRAQCETRSHG